jgi:cytochrome c oxidase assembly factor CtaG
MPDISGFSVALFDDWVGRMSGIVSLILTIVGFARRNKQGSMWTEARLFWTAGLVVFFIRRKRHVGGQFLKAGWLGSRLDHGAP